MTDNEHTAESDARACPKGHDRSAGRWCAECGQYGSHHTLAHAHFTCCLPPAQPEASQ